MNLITYKGWLRYNTNILVFQNHRTNLFAEDDYEEPEDDYDEGPPGPAVIWHLFVMQPINLVSQSNVFSCKNGYCT